MSDRFSSRDGEPLDLAGTMAVLRQTPTVLRALLTPLLPSWLDADEGPGTWTPRQVLQHLVWGEVDDWLPRVRLICTQGPNEAFRPFDRDEGFRRYAGWPIERLLAEFTARRGESLAGLDALALGPEAMSRQGRHPEFGIVTLGELLATWLTHDLAHLTQIGRALTRRAGSAAGPWRAYFSLLRQPRPGPSRE